MASFFEKLKKGMGIGESTEEKAGETEEAEEAEEIEEKEKIGERPVRKKKVPKAPKENRLPAGQVKKIEVEERPPEAKAEEISIEKPAEEKKEKWPEPVGQLAIDVYQTATELVIQSAIAGVKPENLDISIEREVLAIKGNRQKPFDESGDYFTQECYWGSFSREVILPVEVDPNQAEATMKDGILTIRIPKILREKKRVIKVKI